VSAEAVGTAVLLATVIGKPRGHTRRAASDTFAGMRPEDVFGLTVLQLLGAGAATALFRHLVPTLPKGAPAFVDPQTESRVREEI
jgi:hypothetical protein